MAKAFSIRFDVDTHLCLQQGVPPLLGLAQELGVKFTFFVNMGVAVSRLAALKALVFKGSNLGKEPVVSLSAREKLGNLQYLNVALFNPYVGLSGLPQIKNIHEQGHEVGLHGGRNHDTWMRQAATWPESKVANEIHWGLEHLKKAGIQAKGFSSPGWTTPLACPEVLKKFGFSYLADEHGRFRFNSQQKQKLQIQSVYTALAGEPGGVGFLEWCRASGLNDKELLKEFERQLSQQNEYAIMYDHPYYAGRKEIATLKACILKAREMGYQIQTIAEHLHV